MLAATSDGVSSKSLHMEGKAIDVRLEGLPLDRLRDLALARAAGGVGYYPELGFRAPRRRSRAQLVGLGRGDCGMPSAFWQATGLLVVSNVFMTFAWYAHLKELNDKPWYFAALVSWGIALVEYLFMVPANRIGFTVMSLPQLKILQEVITLIVFVPFLVFFMRQGLKLDYLWAALCIVGAVYFVFRSS